jgi:hypothetical protein
MGLKDVELDSSTLGLGSIVGFCKHDNEVPETLTDGNFLRSRAAQRRERDGFLELEQSHIDLTTIRVNLVTFTKITLHTSLQRREQFIFRKYISS